MKSLNEQKKRMQELMGFTYKDNSHDILSEENFKSIEVVENNLLSEQTIRTINGKRYEVNTDAATPYNGDKLGINFEAGKSNITPEGETLLANELKKLQLWLTNNKNLSEENIVVNVKAGSSNYWSRKPNKSTDATNNKNLTKKRAQAGRDVVEKLAGNIFDKNELSRISFTFDGESGANQGPYWGDVLEKNPKADYEKYKDSVKKYQYVELEAFATGKKETLKRLPEICYKPLQIEGGRRSSESTNWMVYPENGGKGMEIQMGEGIGKITFTFDAKLIPDMFRLTYNDVEYYSQYNGKSGFISSEAGRILKAKNKDLKEINKKLDAIDDSAEKKIVSSLVKIGRMVDNKGDKIWSSLDKKYETKQGEKTFLEILGMANKLSEAEMKAFKDKFRGFFKEIENNLNLKNSEGGFNSTLDAGEAGKWLDKKDNRKRLYYLIKTFSKLYTTERKLSKIFGVFAFKKQNEFKKDVIALNNLQKALNEPNETLKNLVVKYEKLKQKAGEVEIGELTQEDLENWKGKNSSKFKVYLDTIEDIKGVLPDGKDSVVGPKGTIVFDKIEGVDVGYLQVWAPLKNTIWDLGISCVDEKTGERAGVQITVGSESEEKEAIERGLEDYIAKNSDN